MKIGTVHFNIILLLAGLLTGCSALSGDKKELSTIELHLESSPDDPAFSEPVPIYRAHPAYVNVSRLAFLDERDLEQAAVVDWMGGFAIQLVFNEHGQLVLENTTRSNPSHRIAVLAGFGESRWLAAPLVNRPITDGQFTFTPDATREEAERIVRGLTNTIAQLKK